MWPQGMRITGFRVGRSDLSGGILIATAEVVKRNSSIFPIVSIDLRASTPAARGSHSGIEANKVALADVLQWWVSHARSVERKRRGGSR
jgi:hypothetical protein